MAVSSTPSKNSVHGLFRDALRDSPPAQVAGDAHPAKTLIVFACGGKGFGKAAIVNKSEFLHPSDDFVNVGGRCCSPPHLLTQFR